MGIAKALFDSAYNAAKAEKCSYPSRPYDKTLSLFAQALEENVSRIAVIEEDSGIVGFCKVDLHGDGTGKLDYLVVLPQCRGRKYGKALMDWPKL